MAATKSSGSGAKKAAGTAKKATKAAKSTGTTAGGGDKLTLSRQTLQELQSLVSEATAVRQSRKVCIA